VTPQASLLVSKEIETFALSFSDARPKTFHGMMVDSKTKQCNVTFYLAFLDMLLYSIKERKEKNIFSRFELIMNP